MSRERVTDDAVVYEFGPEMDAAVTVTDGATLTVETRDSLEGAVRTDDDVMSEVPEEVNAATGPIAVEGAGPGDVLGVAIEAIRPAEDRGRAVTIPEFGLLQDDERIDHPASLVTPVEGDTLSVGEFDVPLDPCIGTIGVATAGDTHSTLVPHDHGGNLDTTLLRAGNTVYFPVNRPGGMLAMGDCKAAMADGEACGTGAEIATEIDCTVTVESGDLSRPLVETDDSWAFLASAETMEEACRIAYRDAIDALAEDADLSLTDAYMLASLVADLEISQVVDPLVTVRAVVPKRYLTNPLD
ncbi:acetamidase/formamidase family protein [Halomarina oriensis]|uniref:Acetamidase n=1 Tax=Halomarina oriensis TaxID=671145 RepID=A0A6B0GMS5_9EURY|nr:acetamidase/formamidase family protein [Halomarina oriensis]MWG35960.1 acetamidase [Halomarina oriensis]